MTIKNNKSNKLIKKLVKNDFKSFLIKAFNTLHPTEEYVDNWHIDLIISCFEQFESNKMRRLVINMPPRSLKSFCISVVWPAWILGVNPSKKIIVASYSQTLSDKHSLDCRTIMQTKWYKEFFPTTEIKKGQNQKYKFVTEQHGFRFATSVGGSLIGEGADYIIIDDPQTPEQANNSKERERVIDWYQKALLTRLNNKRSGAIVLVMQRLHDQDLSGFLLKKNFNHLKLPIVAEQDCHYHVGNFSYTQKQGELLNQAIDSKESIEELQMEIGAFAFSSQYQQSPVSVKKGIIKAKWLNYYDELPDGGYIYQSWDSAIKADKSHDFSVCTTWVVSNNQYFLMDLLKVQVDYPELKRLFHRQAEQFSPHKILVEDKASGQQLVQEMRNSRFNIIPIQPKYDKVTRLILTSPLFEAGKFYLPRAAPWLEDMELELLSFPNCEHDDQVDSISQFLSYIMKQNAEEEYMVTMRRL